MWNILISKVANSGCAMLQWVHSAKLSVMAITNCQSYKFSKSSIMSNRVKVWRQPPVTVSSFKSELYISNYSQTLMQIMTEEVETALCDSLYSLKFQVRVARQQFQLQSNVYTNSYRRCWDCIMWFVIYHYKLPYHYYITLQK